MKLKFLLKFILIFFLTIQPVVGIAFADNSYDYQTCVSKFSTKDAKGNYTYADTYKDLYFAVRQNEKDGSNNALFAADCPPSVEDISWVVLRVITLIITIFGVIVLFAIIRSAIQMITAGPNKDKVKAARAGLQSAFMGLAIMLMAYTLIVFIAVRLGLSGNPDQFSILDGGNLIFKFIFNY